MGNRTTVKNNIQVINVPTVSNADMNTMLQTNICDSVVFKEDVSVNQTSTVTAITCDFTGKDRINLTRTGGALQITVAGIVDGDRVFLLVSKTAGQAVTWVGVTDITPVKANADALSLVLYEIIRKGVNYFALAYVETVLMASNAEIVTGTVQNKLVSVVGLHNKKASSSVRGLIKQATSLDTDNNYDTTPGGDTTAVPPSELNRVLGNARLKYVNIGAWNMDSTASVTVAHGVTASKIRAVKATIISDLGTVFYDFTDSIVWSSLGVVLTRTAAGIFDNVNFDDAVMNRGYISIEYIL